MQTCDAGQSRGLIYDVGAHKGEDTEYYLKKGFSVVAIEPNPELYSKLVVKFAEFLNAGRLSLLDVAIADAAGEKILYVNADSVWTTTNPEWAERNQKLGAPSTPVVVKSERFETILRKYGMPYYLKIDIEGADILCLHALKNFSQRPKFVSLESNKTNWRMLLEEFSLLSSLGYSDYKIVNQGSVPNQQQPKPPREGVFCQHAFEYGSSGLFGEELPQEWMSKTHAIFKYFLIFARYKLFGDNTFGSRLVQGVAKFLPTALWLLPPWYDTHARLK